MFTAAEKQHNYEVLLGIIFIAIIIAIIAIIADGIYSAIVDRKLSPEEKVEKAVRAMQALPHLMTELVVPEVCRLVKISKFTRDRVAAMELETIVLTYRVTVMQAEQLSKYAAYYQQILGR